MDVRYRRATFRDAQQLFELRRKSIVTLASKGMPISRADAWAANLTMAGMKRKIREMEIWVVELDHAPVSWGAIRGDQLQGLYVDPKYSGRGIGTKLLGMLEGLIRARGILTVHAEASSNAEEFYLSRGYERVGPRSPEEAQSIVKQFK